MLTMFHYKKEFNYHPVTPDVTDEGSRDFDDVILYCLNYDKLDQDGVDKLLRLLDNDERLVEQRIYSSKGSNTNEAN